MISLLLSVSLAQSVPLGPEPAEPTGSVTAVTVFQDRARVTRTQSVQLSPGANTVVFRNLPPTLDSTSLVASGTGAGAALRGLDAARRELAEDRRERVAALEGRKESLQDELREKRDDKEAATQELTFVRSLSAASASQLSAELMFVSDTTTDADALAALIRRRTEAALAEIRTSDQAARDLEASIAAIDRELAQVRGSAQWARYDITVHVDAAEAGPGEIALTYTVPGASWTPRWDVRAASGSETLALSLAAQVRQTTGEDWTRAALTLSTAQPSVGVQAPSLDPFWLSSPYDQGYGMTGRSAYDGVADDAPYTFTLDLEEYDAEPEAAEVPMSMLSADVQVREVATTFEIPGESAVPGDGTSRTLAVADAEGTAEWVHVAVPVLDDRAWRVADLTWTESWPMLAGPASLFMDDAYVGSMAVPRIGTGGNVELGFGPDEAVRVERTVVEDLLSGPNLWGRHRLERSWRTTVTNGRAAPISLSLRDRLPQSTESKWKVRAQGDEPDVTADEGLLRWERDLAPGGELTVSSGWTLKFPKKNPPAIPGGG